jgi:hypothetical protein
MSEAYEVKLQSPASAHAEPVLEVQRPASAAYVASAEIQNQRPPPTSINQVIADLKLATLQPPKPVLTKLGYTHEKPVVYWRRGFVEGVSYAMQLLEGVH